MKVGNYSLRNLGIVVLSGILTLGFSSPNVFGAPTPCDTCGCSAGQTVETVMKEVKGNTIVDVAVDAGSFNTLVAALKAAGLVDTLKGKGPFTVFAPTDEAFSRIPKSELSRLLKPENIKELQTILTYHVVSGNVKAADVVKLKSAKTVQGQEVGIQVNKSGVYLDNAKVIKTDIMASNGVIHVIDSVIMPKDIVDMAIAAGSFKTLLAAVKAADLVETLKGKGPFTVFAPSDEAFNKLPKETLRDLLKPENKSKLQAILTYHVIPQSLAAEMVLKSKSAKTVNGQSVAFQVRKGNVYVGDAQVVKTDISATNGLIHVIDTVLIPQ